MDQKILTNGQGILIFNLKHMKSNLILKETVNNILEHNEKARASDALLVFEVWKHFASIKGITLDDRIYELLQDYFPDTITRIRRKLNQEGLYLPPKEVQLKRKRNEVDHREAYRDQPDKDCPIWTNKDGEKIEVFRMADEYITNVIKHLSGRINEMNAIRDMVPRNEEARVEMEVNQLQEWLDIFKHELRNRIGKEISDKRVDELELDKNFTQPEYKNLDRTIPVCSNCGAVDHTPFDNRHCCNREYQEERGENMEYYD